MLVRHLDDLLTRKNANASAHAVRAYLQLTAHCDGELADLTADPIRAYLAYLADISELSAATRKRKRAAVSSRASPMAVAKTWPSPRKPAPTRPGAQARVRCPVRVRPRAATRRRA